MRQVEPLEVRWAGGMRARQAPPRGSSSVTRLSLGGSPGTGPRGGTTVRYKQFLLAELSLDGRAIQLDRTTLLVEAAGPHLQWTIEAMTTRRVEPGTYLIEARSRAGRSYRGTGIVRSI